VIDYIFLHLDKNETVIGLIGVYSDLQKAFDTVNHDLLLHKLYIYGIRGISHDWFTNFLCNRKQYTVIVSSNSSMLEVTFGVPQGSVLWPLLFLIYLNAMANAISGEQVKLFADDTNLFISRKNTKETIIVANDCINSLYKSFVAINFSINLDKTF